MRLLLLTMAGPARMSGLAVSAVLACWTVVDEWDRRG